MPHKVPDAEMLAKYAVVSKAYTDEVQAYLLSLCANPRRYKEANDRYEASFSASLDGDPAKVAVCEADRKELDRQHTLLVGLAKLAAQQDPSVPEKLGLGALTAKTANFNTPLPKPNKIKVAHGPNSTEMLVSVPCIKRARMYEVWGCQGDPSFEQNWKLIAASPNCRGILVKGLTPGTKYWFRVRAVRTGEAGPWSNYVILMAI